MDKGELYGDPFYEDEPFYRAGMPAEEFQRERKYLNDNIDSFIKGGYRPLWKQRLKKSTDVRTHMGNTG